MSDAGPFDAVQADPPAPWGARPLAGGIGLRQLPNDPNSNDMTKDQLSSRVDRLESEHRALLIAFGAAFVILLAAFGGGFVFLAGKLDTGFSQVSQKIDATNAVSAQILSDVAVLKERTARNAPPASPS